MTNALCDRLLLMGFLEELHEFSGAHVEDVVKDIASEFQAPPEPPKVQVDEADMAVVNAAYPDGMDERMMRLERSMGSVLNILKKIVAAPTTQGNLGNLGGAGTPAGNAAAQDNNE